MRRSVANILAILFTVILVLVLISGFPPSPVKQVVNPDANPLDFDGSFLKFLGLIAAVVAVVGATGFAIWQLLLYLSNEVSAAKEAPNEPTNPLNYRTYGHLMAVVLPIVIALGTLGLLFQTQMLPVQAAEEAVITDHIFHIEYVVISIIFGLVVGLMIHFLLYFRAEPGDLSDGLHIHGSMKFEALWTFIPLVFVVSLGIYSIHSLTEVTKAKPGELGIKVEGFQWGWSFIYPAEMFFSDAELAELDPRQLADIERVGGIASSELVLLLNQTARLDMHSVDVIHSFWVPEMRIKQDVVPGVETNLRYTPILAGDYRVRCAELCGLNHWQMMADVRVYDDTEYSNWKARLKSSLGNPVDAGRSIYTQLCATCHSTDGSRMTGPTWTDLVGSERNFEDGGTALANLAYVQESIWNPNAHIVDGYLANLMPADFNNRVSAVQVEQIFAYMCSISTHTDNVEDECKAVNPNANTLSGGENGSETSPAGEGDDGSNTSENATNPNSEGE